MEILIPEHVFKKVMHWVNKSSNEVSGFGKVVRHPETGGFEIVEAYLIDQVGGAAHTDIDDKALGKLLYQTKDLPGDLRWWWHSHVKMQVFWSGTDTSTIKELGKQGWIVASVFNQMEEVRSALCYQTESIFGAGVELHDNISTQILTNVDLEEVAKWDAEFDAKVKQQVWRPPVYSGNNNQPSLIYSEAHGSRVNPYEDPYSDPYADYYYRPDDKKEAGLIGAGLTIEAMALGMSVQAYCDKLNAWDSAEIDRMTDILEAKVNAGVINIGSTYATES